MQVQVFKCQKEECKEDIAPFFVWSKGTFTVVCCLHDQRHECCLHKGQCDCQRGGVGYPIGGCEVPNQKWQVAIEEKLPGCRLLFGQIAAQIFFNYQKRHKSHQHDGSKEQVQPRKRQKDTSEQRN